MDIAFRKGVTVAVNPAEQSNEWLLQAAREINDAALVRGLELPAAAGSLAVGGVTRSDSESAQETVAEPDTKESLRGQIHSASVGYLQTVDALNGNRQYKDRIAEIDEKTITAEFDEWFTDSKLAYVRAAQAADPDLRFTLIATPNAEISKEDIIKAARILSPDQGQITYVWDDFYRMYTSKQLAGTDPSNRKHVKLSLVPSKASEKLPIEIYRQRDLLLELRGGNPDLHIPTVLDAITYWQTLRARGEVLADLNGITEERTSISHRDLPVMDVSGWRRVPRSFINGGTSHLSFAFAENPEPARIAIG